ncbi:MAG: diacylglycerol kinase family protein [Thermoleophilaceae bacterium]
MSRKLLLLVNPAAAGGRSLGSLAEAREALVAAGAEHRVVQTRGLDHARDLAGEAAASGEAIVAVGGDGMVGALAGVLRDAPVPLGIVPSGRGNDFARVLGIPSAPAAAARLLLDGPERLVDVAEAGGHPFVGIASVGFDSDANRIANETKRIRGNLVYVVAALRALAAWQPATFSVTVDGERTEVTGYSVAIGNSKAYGGGMFLIPHAEVDDGRLDVLLSGETSKLSFLKGLPKVFKGTHTDDPSVSFLSGREVEVDADRPFTVYADGDPIGELPMKFTLRERCLRVIVPPS